MAVRLLLAAVFIFSGFVKAVDPWGTAIKIGEYLSVFNMEWLDWAKFPASIFLSGLELILGLALLFGVRLRQAAFVTMLFMVCMTGLTLYSAVAEPVSDCGCFGDAVKLSNWNTFFKNLVLLPMSIVVWRWAPRSGRFVLRDGLWLALMAIFSFGIGVYCYRHMPLIDFLPYKVGVDLRAEEAAPEEQVEPRVVYKDKRSGQEQVFALSDTTWYDSERWEWVETIDAPAASGVRVSTQDLRIYGGAVDVTDDYIYSSGGVMMICALDLNDITGRCRERLEQGVADAARRSIRVVCLTSTPLTDRSLVLGGEPVACYNVDGVTLKTMLRAKVGIIILRDGVITRKANCRDILCGGELKTE